MTGVLKVEVLSSSQLNVFAQYDSGVDHVVDLALCAQGLL